jgi:ABC-type Na+ efflux pump permease subunit
MEVLLSSVSPIQLMAGKILGIAATGLAMLGSWMVFFYLATKYLPRLLSIEVGFDLSVIATDPVYIGSFLVYFLLGYLLYASLLVAIGSACNSLKEAQNLMMPVTLMLIVPLAAMVPISRDPNGMLAKTMSYIPPFTPFVMMNRAAGPPTTQEYVVTTIVLLLAVALVMWGAAKVFRVGVLMTGKAPRLGEIIRWIRAPVGMVPVRKNQ